VAGGMVLFMPAAEAITIPVACRENALVAAVNHPNNCVGSVPAVPNCTG
jgi:hypothetical protein